MAGNVETSLAGKRGAPAIEVGAVALAERDGDNLDVGELLLDLGGQLPVDVGVQLAAGDVDLGLDAQALLDVLLVGDDDIGILGQLSGAVLPYFQSFLRKFRSMETVAPAFLAACMAARAASAASWLTAGVMPVTWNHSASFMMEAKS